MRLIEDEQSLRDLLNAQQAILFFHCRWGYSWFLLPTAEKWEREWITSGTGPNVPVFIAVDDSPTPYPETFRAWVKSQGLDAIASAGNGEMLWLERGRVVGKLLGRARQGVSPIELSERTAELWGFD